MDDDVCIAPKSYKKPSIRCTRIATHGYFCKYHKRSGYVCDQVKNKFGKKRKEIYVDLYCEKIIESIDNHAKKLDLKCSYSLIGLYDSWITVPFYKRIEIENVWWNIDILIDILIQQLNTSNMNSPSPKFPYNPFTLRKFKIETLKYLIQYIKTYKISLDYALYTFLSYIDDICNDIDKKEDYVSYIISEYLSILGRFMTLNLKDSQGCYVGKWVLSDTPLSPFEDIYSLLRIVPYQTVDYDYRGMPVLIDNPERKRISDTLDNMKPDIFKTDKIFFLEN